jgi:hypothetical protein
MAQKFNNAEKFLLGLFTHKHMGKSWVAIEEKDTCYKVSLIQGGKTTARIDLMKDEDGAFKVDVVGGHCVECHITWQSDLVELLQRVEIEMSLREV